MSAPKALQPKRKPAFLAATTLATLAILQTITSLGFIVGIELSVLHLPVALVLGIGAGAWLSHTPWPRQALPKGILYIMALGILALIMGFFQDASFDGQAYHQDVIYKLAHGWNPVREYVDQRIGPLIFALNHYPKITWISQASIYIITGDIDTAKAFNPLLLASAFMLTHTLLGVWLPSRRLRWLISALVVGNPVVLGNTLNSTVDGFGYLAFVAVLTSGILYIKTANLRWLVLYGVATLIALNVKFPSTAYTLVLSTFMGLYLLLKQRKLVLPFSTATIIATFVGICIAGYSPYMTNLTRGKHILYPAMGSGEFSDFLIRSQSPSTAFYESSRFVKAFYSYFGESNTNETVDAMGMPILKIPFTVSPHEFSAFFNPYVKMGGFGPFFGGILLLSLVVGLITVRISKEVALYSWLMALAIVAITFINPEAWWVRLAPQMWLTPIVLLTGYAIATQKAGWKTYLPLGILTLNCTIILSLILLNQRLADGYLAKQVAILRTLPPGTQLVVANPWSPINVSRFEKYGILPKAIIANNDCVPYVKALNTRWTFCLDYIPEPQKSQLLNLEAQPYTSHWR